jgi:hypothetical protein
MAIDQEGSQPVSDSDRCGRNASMILARADRVSRLISAVQSCFYELIKKQEEQADRYVSDSCVPEDNLNGSRIHRAVETLKPRESFDKKTAFWESYMKLADEHDKEFQKKYSTDLDTALIFVRCGWLQLGLSDFLHCCRQVYSPRLARHSLFRYNRSLQRIPRALSLLLKAFSTSASLLRSLQPFLQFLASNGSCTTRQPEAEDPSKNEDSSVNVNSTACADGNSM